MQLAGERPMSEESRVTEKYKLGEPAIANYIFHDSSEIDFDYEFDAPRFFDFLSPESKPEVQNAEEWFRFAGTYPSSPYILKVKWRISELLLDEGTSGSETTDSESLVSTGYTTDMSLASESSYSSHKLLLEAKLGSKTMPSRQSTLMRPTLSYLAKYDQPIPLRISSESFGSNYSKSTISKSKSGDLGGATNRQKLPNKARFSSLSTSSSRSTLTIPKGPVLQTAQRAQRRSCGKCLQPDDRKSKVRTYEKHTSHL